ncbi:uncharacterized protein LY89DRAFT_192064 [Mollisia scopiformis]|uniref:Uncharacterized protein n=1 Tax=Mollisia scopiformis TaxID=149040 RepID=A0A194WXV0_MOLSC|nr:uncharacterized protein LY89DRAFT_192064 [Mollisia scopiformis]KUJ12760.1 hypothetical protein LY89DRAFT_192064 [Mollisia scopiformis]
MTSVYSRIVGDGRGCRAYEVAAFLVDYCCRWDRKVTSHQLSFVFIQRAGEFWYRGPSHEEVAEATDERREGILSKRQRIRNSQIQCYWDLRPQRERCDPGCGSDWSRWSRESGCRMVDGVRYEMGEGKSGLWARDNEGLVCRLSLSCNADGEQKSREAGATARRARQLELFRFGSMNLQMLWMVVLAMYSMRLSQGQGTPLKPACLLLARKNILVDASSPGPSVSA